MSMISEQIKELRKFQAALVLEKKHCKNGKRL